MWDDKIGDSGNNLTTGQRKILMYLHALLTDKTILVLENPFTGLSVGTTEVIRKNSYPKAQND